MLNGLVAECYNMDEEPCFIRKAKQKLFRAETTKKFYLDDLPNRSCKGRHVYLAVSQLIRDLGTTTLTKRILKTYQRLKKGGHHRLSYGEYQ